METAVIISLAISGGVAAIQLLDYLRHKETDLAEDMDYMKKDIIQLKIDNSICASDRSHTDEDMKEVVRLLEKLNDRLEHL